MIELIRKLRHVTIAIKAEPFVSGNDRPGLAQIAGKVPSALTRLGVDAALVLPLFNSTREIIKTIETTKNRLVDFGEVAVDHGALAGKAKVKTMLSPLDPAYRVYFIDDKENFGDHPMYTGQATDVRRYALFCLWAIELQRQISQKDPQIHAPDVLACHEPQTAYLPVYLERIVSNEFPRFSYSDTFFDNTVCEYIAHDFGLTADADASTYNELGISPLPPSQLPAYAEVHKVFHPSKMGFYKAERSIARSESYIKEVIGGLRNPGYSDIVRERFKSGHLIGIFPDDSQWGPDRDFSHDLALKWAQRELEKLTQASQKVWEFYQELDAGDQALIDQAIANKEGARFAKVESKEELRDLLSFLRIEPTAGFEARMKEEGLADFLSDFFPGDLDRLLSIKIDPKKYEDLDKYFSGGKGEEEITLSEAFFRYKESDGTLLDHIIGVFQSLKIISSSPQRTEEELARELKDRGSAIPTENLSAATTEFRGFSEILTFVSQDHSLYRAFVLAVLLHDLGKLSRHSTHSADGARLLGEMREVRGLLAKEEIEFAKNVVAYHSFFGDCFLERSQEPEDMRKIHAISSDKIRRDLIIKFIFLLGIADNTTGGKGRLTSTDLRKITDAYAALLRVKSEQDLAAVFAVHGFNAAKEGGKRWDLWVVRDSDPDKDKLADISAATAELDKYLKSKGLLIKHKIFKRQLGAIGTIRKLNRVTKELGNARLRARLLIWLIEYSKGTAEKVAKNNKLEKFITAHKDKYAYDDTTKTLVIKGKSELDEEERNELLAIYTSPEEKEAINRLFRRPPSGSRFKNVNFEISIKTPKKLEKEITVLSRLLKEFDFEEIERRLRFKFNPENDLLEIFIPTDPTP